MKEAENKNQRDRFIAAAKELGADEDEATFKAKLAVIARQKPKGAMPPASEQDKAED